MTFEDKYPSLKGKHFKHDADIGLVFDCYSDSTVAKHCLDKQRVKEVIKDLKINKKHHVGYQKAFNEGYNEALEDIKKELGLDNECEHEWINDKRCIYGINMANMNLVNINKCIKCGKEHPED